MKISIIFFTVLVFLGIGFSSCKKPSDSNTNPTGSTNYNDPMIPESSGWKRVANIKYSGNFVDTKAPCQMTGYDLTMLNGNLQILYSEDKFEGGDKFSFYLKVSTPPNSSTDPIIYYIQAGMPIYPTNKPFFLPVFRPGTFNIETFVIWKEYTDPFYYLDHYDESAKQISTQNPNFDPSNIIKMIPNGDILIGDVNGSYNCELEYYNRISKKWTYINHGAGDLQWLMCLVLK